ncbi:hypothetical protein I6F35_22390 [Bradyrhizobium sp. BRP22]|uniref:DUF4376 domain-containing protein n=1 Tax=Bradyrhizobium sp. BRP22 TaxID=2793821 RepID=UPI001CD21D61|nr:hypothetical protein [Bradyrhizobium sp. BRP22]MCA1455919.1 hypothetical protein [Bradyrhizobium sp. BRP22]
MIAVTAEYDPYDWYWLADDGRLFSSKTSTMIQPDDPDYLAWLESHVATPWPRDDDGEQTLAELQRVLVPFLIWVDLKAYAFEVRAQKEVGSMQVNGIAGLTEIRTDPATQTLLDRYHSVAATNKEFTVKWVNPDRSTVTLDATAIDSLYNQLATFIASTYDMYDQAVSGVDDGSITDTGQIDAIFGVTLERSRKVDIGWKT